MRHLDRSTWRACAVAVAAAFFAVAMGITSPLQAASPSAVGLWRTIDDKTHAPKSIVETFMKDGKLCGRVKQLLGKGTSADASTSRCTACKGPQKDAPIEGLEIMWDLVEDDGSWEKGSVLDPANGTVYRCRVRLMGPDKLEVRGFVGISLFGRTQVWERAPVKPLTEAPKS